MAITRTEYPIANAGRDKSGSLGIRVENIQLDAGDLLLTAVAYDEAQGPPDRVRWGKQGLLAARTVSGNGVGVGVWYHKYEHSGSLIRDLRARWTDNPPTAKAMIAVKIAGARKIELLQSQAIAATTDPNSSSALQTPSSAEGFYWGIHASEGSVNDALGALDLGYTRGLRQGTGGAPAASNVTVEENYKIVSLAEATRASLVGAANRDWASILITLHSGTALEAQQEDIRRLMGVRRVSERMDGANTVVTIRHLSTGDIYTGTDPDPVTAYTTAHDAWFAAHGE